jgi:hypothetical protein
MRQLRRFSFDIRGQFLGNHRADILDFISRYKPTTVRVMDDDDLGRDIADATGGETLVIQRRWAANDMAVWNPALPDYQMPQQFVAGQTRNGTMDHRFAVYALNEPQAHGDDVSRLGDWLIEVGRECTRLGYRAVLGNIGPAIYERAEIEQGRFLPYLDYLHQEGEKEDGHLGGWHEYSQYFLPLGFGVYEPDELRDWSRLQPPWRDVPPDAPRYLLRRVEWITDWAATQGVGNHKKAITEFGWDDMPNLAPFGLKDYFRMEYGVPANDQGQPYEADYAGARACEYIWRDWWSGWTLEDAMLAQLRYANRNYPADYVSFNLFSIGYGDFWDLQRGQNYGTLTALQNALVALCLEDAEPPVEEPPVIEPPVVIDPEPENKPLPLVAWLALAIVAGVMLAIVVGVLYGR